MSKERKSSKFWDRIAQKPSGEIKSNATLKTIELTKKHLKKEDLVLDFGCGTGTITAKLSSNVRTIRGIDISAGMITVAAESSMGIENVLFEQLDIADSSLKEATFDAILAFNVLHYIDDLPNELKRINALLKPGGLFISSTACINERRTFLGFLIKIAVKIGLVPKMRYYKTSELETLVLDANFSIVESVDLSKIPERFLVMKKR